MDVLSILLAGFLWRESTGHRYRSPVDSLHKGPVRRSFDDFLNVQIKVLNKQSGCRWFETPSQRTHDAITTSSLRQNDVATQFRRNNDVVIAWCVPWDDAHVTSLEWLPSARSRWHFTSPILLSLGMPNARVIPVTVSPVLPVGAPCTVCSQQSCRTSVTYIGFNSPCTQVRRGFIDLYLCT